MRSEKEMMYLIIQTAAGDDRIRAAYLEGSRVNPRAPKDLFQDYDVVYLVRETASFRNDPNWIDRFGERLYMQYPEDSVYYPSDVEHCYGWLMQFADGNRLDLHVCTPEGLDQRLELFRVLLDKDGLLPPSRENTDEPYWIRRPTQEEFDFTCNDFWWCMNNVAKGLWRDEPLYVADMLDFCLRPALKRLLEWRIGMENNFAVSAGKSAKYMKHFLPQADYCRFAATYATLEIEQLWRAVFSMCDLFEETAQLLRKELKLVYNEQEASASRGYLEHVQALPHDAREIY